MQQANGLHGVDRRAMIAASFVGSAVMLLGNTAGALLGRFEIVLGAV